MRFCSIHRLRVDLAWHVYPHAFENVVETENRHSTCIELLERNGAVNFGDDSTSPKDSARAPATDLHNDAFGYSGAVQVAAALPCRSWNRDPQTPAWDRTTRAALFKAEEYIVNLV